MKNIWRRTLSLMLTLSLLLAVAVASIPTAQAETVTEKWGDHTWSFNSSTGELKITGRGAMKEGVSQYAYPWRVYGYDIKRITVGHGITKISKWAFYGPFQKLESVSLPDTVVEIGVQAFAFQESKSFTRIEIPVSVEIIGRGAFTGCEALTEVTFNEQLIGSSGTRAKKLDIGELAFAGSPVATLNLGSDSVPITIGNHAFESCDQLKSLTNTERVETIGNYAFSNCDALESVIFSPRVKSIGDYAFSSCDALESVTVSPTVQSIGKCAFEKCVRLSSLEFAPNGQIPTIAEAAFRDCDTLKSVTLPDSVTAIEFDAFFGCNALNHVSLPGHEITIADGAFEFTNVECVEIRQGLQTLGTWINKITDLHKLKEIALPNTLRKIADDVSLGNDAIVFCGTEVQWSAVQMGTVHRNLPVSYHRYEPTETTTETHTLACALCGNQKSREPHDFTWKKVDNTQHKGICSLCGKEIMADHVLGAPIADPYNSNQHVQTCTDCGIKVVSNHTGKWKNVNSQYHSIKCKCGKVQSEEHSFGKWTEKDAAQHERTCKDCGATDAKEHLWDEADGSCVVCGAEKSGCASSLGGGIGMAVLALAAASLALRKIKRGAK